MTLILWRVVAKHVLKYDSSGIAVMLFPEDLGDRRKEVVYATTSKSQALFEILIHSDPPPSTHDYIAIPMLVPNTVRYKSIQLAELPPGWPSNNARRSLRERRFSEKEFAVYLVPSHTVYGEHIALIDISHKDFFKLVPAPAESIFWDDVPFMESQIINLEAHKDVFLCHASEDKTAIVEPLFRALFLEGVSCWYDNAEIKWGDSITAKVNEGLAKSA